MLAFCYYYVNQWHKKRIFAVDIESTLNMKSNKQRQQGGKIQILYLSPLIFIGLIGALSLQSIWLYNTYILIKDNIQKECYTILEKALREEANIRFGQTPKGTTIESGSKTDTIPSETYLFETLSDMGYPMSLYKLDSIASLFLHNNKINDDFSISIINQNGTILNKSKKQEVSSWITISSKPFPIRSDYSQTVQLTIKNPYNTFFEHMGLLLIATVIIMIFVIGCIIYQVNIISRLKRIFQIREDFSYAMIHDMKTPLSTIFMTLNFLHSGRLDDKPEMKEKYYKIAESEADHLLTLTNKVLTISKLEKHKMEMVKKEVPLAPIIERLTEKFTTKASKPVHFTINLKTPEVYADEEYLEEVISNLIDNAIKYSKESVEIQISSDSNETDTILKVHDNGLGIPKEDQRIIFQKYERASATKRNKNGGAAGFGLGLNFVDQVITAHEGKIVVNSIEGEFTEFIIYLPQVIQKL